MKQRSKHSLTTLVLSATAAAGDKGIAKTRLIQEVMLNHKRANRYCDYLSGAGLLACDAATGRYRITQKGMRCLTLSQELAGYISPVHAMIAKYESIFTNPEQSYFDSRF